MHFRRPHASTVPFPAFQSSTYNCGVIRQHRVLNGHAAPGVFGSPHWRTRSIHGFFDERGAPHMRIRRFTPKRSG
jgi:hypothetical protein